MRSKGQRSRSQTHHIWSKRRNASTAFRRILSGLYFVAAFNLWFRFSLLFLAASVAEVAFLSSVYQSRSKVCRLQYGDVSFRRTSLQHSVIIGVELWTESTKLATLCVTVCHPRLIKKSVHYLTMRLTIAETSWVWFSVRQRDAAWAVHARGVRTQSVSQYFIKNGWVGDANWFRIQHLPYASDTFVFLSAQQAELFI